MYILLIGGPKFMGRAVIDSALARGHQITTFNRGQTNPELYPEIEKLRGDRDGELDALRGRTWDAVIDTCGYFPRIVKQSAQLLADAVERYVFVSSISVYAEIPAGTDENGKVATLVDPTVEEITGETYGALKVLCENAVRTIYGERAVISRPGLIVGAHDGSFRFPYWVHRVSQGGDVLYPAGHTVQIIDVRDLADWTIHLLESGTTGIFNATGPDKPLTFQHMLETIRETAGSDATLHGADDDFLLSHKVTPWSEFPLWLPSEPGWSEVNINRALDAGLTFRPLSDTVQDTLKWLKTYDTSGKLPAGMERSREAELLQAWQSSQNS
jgi:2'-hydroxyisoflavone reductase